MTVHTAVEGEPTPGPSQCWCCGLIEDPARLVHLGNHPEVVLCTGCAHWLGKRAGEIEDQARTGPAVRARERLRRLRRTVVAHGWHRSTIVGRGLRWIERFTP